MYASAQGPLILEFILLSSLGCFPLSKPSPVTVGEFLPIFYFFLSPHLLLLHSLFIYLFLFYVFTQVLKISLIGHRKRILASLGDRLHEDTPQKPPRAISLRVSRKVRQQDITYVLNALTFRNN